ncbi:hypothetical protein DY000_02061525 [Brassica cretica]|uniref:Uncharacterized protein n=1 Tax=Brassica cretica TaxID=69181 RepID=A0ABQ7B0H3_BRACR|nr:hypothetical protein DY000_02061525 [Brassica cretica]
MSMQQLIAAGLASMLHRFWLRSSRQSVAYPTSQSLSFDLDSISVIIIMALSFGFSSFLRFFNNLSLAFNRLCCLTEFMLLPP